MSLRKTLHLDGNPDEEIFVVIFPDVSLTKALEWKFYTLVSLKHVQILATPMLLTKSQTIFKKQKSTLAMR